MGRKKENSGTMPPFSKPPDLIVPFMPSYGKTAFFIDGRKKFSIFDCIFPDVVVYFYLKYIATSFSGVKIEQDPDTYCLRHDGLAPAADCDMRIRPGDKSIEVERKRIEVNG